jgi:hypothetical protein
MNRHTGGSDDGFQHIENRIDELETAHYFPYRVFFGPLENCTKGTTLWKRNALSGFTFLRL